MYSIKEAFVSDASFLTQIALKSKSVWGYPQQWLDLWRDELTIDESYINNNHVYCVVNDDNVIGFYALVNKDENVIELDHFWLLPDYTGMGFGRKMLAHAKMNCNRMGFERIMLVSDPNAVDFYLHMGGEIIDYREYLFQKDIRRLPIILFSIKSNN